MAIIEAQSYTITLMLKTRLRAALVFQTAGLGPFLLMIALLASHRHLRAEHSPAAHDPDTACEPCHREIYRRYKESPMARASGPAIDGLISADFLHELTGIRYRIYARDGHVYMSYERGRADDRTALKGEEELPYFLGSGKRGRTFLFQREGYWFEIPINWYAKKQLWDMAPNYQKARQMPLTLPVDSGCLHCHASGVQRALAGARNHYAGMPFINGGITCEGCHGDPSAHLASAGRGPIVNPDKFAPNQRDSVCLQCHLEAEITVNRNGFSIADFRPGAEISDYVTHFVHKTAVGAGGRATSQWEALLQSACKRQSGDRLTCTTCHDPHSSPAAQQSVAFYRGRCLSCHTGEKFALGHHPEQPDCASCHMPRGNTQDIAHEQVTDHRIQVPGKPMPQLAEPGPSGNLVEVRGTGGAPAGNRDLGMAYSQLALRGDREAGEKARKLLRLAESAVTGGPAALHDPDLHTQLGFLDQIAGDNSDARAEYLIALADDPLNPTAAGNLALIEAQGGDPRQAVGRWTSVVTHDPAQSKAALNLATVLCRLGDAPAALRVLERTLLFSPDDRDATNFAGALRSDRAGCRARQ